MNMSENFVSMKQVVEAAFPLGYIHGESGHCLVADIVAEMTGLDMTKYDLVPSHEDPLCPGWLIVRKADA